MCREGLACRYEQTVTTDGSGVAAALPGPRCSLPPGWRPRPINPKPCHLFCSSWIQRGSREGCFTGFLARAQLSPDLFLSCVWGDCRTAAVTAGRSVRDVEVKQRGGSCERLNCFRAQRHLRKPFWWMVIQQAAGRTHDETKDNSSLALIFRFYSPK